MSGLLQSLLASSLLSSQLVHSIEKESLLFLYKKGYNRIQQKIQEVQYER